MSLGYRKRLEEAQEVDPTVTEVDRYVYVDYWKDVVDELTGESEKVPEGS